MDSATPTENVLEIPEAPRTSWKQESSFRRLRRGVLGDLGEVGETGDFGEGGSPPDLRAVGRPFPAWTNAAGTRNALEHTETVYCTHHCHATQETPCSH